jgi:putative N6-adenine-specific DNA methylase
VNKILITCPKGIPPYLSEEVLSLGLPVTAEAVAGIQTEGNMEDAMRLNLYLRTAHRVLFLIKNFRAEDPNDLYRELYRMPWEDHIFKDGYISITSSVDNPTIRDTRFANLKCKDAVADRIKETMGQRPDSGPKRDRAVLDLYWKGDRCSIYLDTSGEPLSKRGYRKIPLDAPMQETLAAAVVKASGWKGKGNFINPMCGSGTLAVEAALSAIDKAPGLMRDNFSFMHFRGYDKSVWEKLKIQAVRKILKTIDGRIIATDIRKEAVEAAKKNAAAAGVSEHIEFRACDFTETDVPAGSGVVVLNPEYGVRMGDMTGLGDTYKGMGDFFKQKCTGYRGYIFTGNLQLAKMVGLRTSRKLQFYNSDIECRLLEYELYEGSRK